MSVYEKKLIGGILSGAVEASTLDLDPSDLDDFAEAFAACRKIESDGLAATPELLAMRLADSEGFYTADDYRQMAANVTSASVVFEAVGKVKASALKTFLRDKVARLAGEDEHTGAQILDALKTIVADADRHYRTNENNFVFLSEIVPRLAALYDDLHKGISYSLSTGFGLIDHQLNGGFSKADLHVVIAQTGQGKSALALNCARYQAEQGLTVGAVSREMSDLQNAMRLQSSMQKIPRWQMSPGMFDGTHGKLKAGLADLAKLPIAFDVRTGEISSLRVQARRMVEQYGMAILYVDYLQLMKGGGATRAEEVAAVSRGLKEIAMENNIPVVALCQFNRGALNASIFELLSHVKESSGIEQDASTMLYIQLEKTETPKDIRDAVLYVLKNRDGATFRPIDMFYHGPTCTFSEVRPDAN